MKKILVTLSLFLAFVSSAFALDLQIGADLTMPLKIAKPDGADKSTLVTNFGIDVNADYFFTDLIGIGGDFTFVIPLKSHCDGNSAKVNGDGYKTYSIDMFVGCAFRLLNKDNMQFIVTPGLAIDYSWYKYEWSLLGMSGTEKGNDTDLGIGADAKFAYKFNDKIGINGGAFMGFYFDTYNRFVFTPKVGATYFF